MAAEKLEIIYGQCPMVSQIFVYGDSARSFLVAIVVNVVVSLVLIDGFRESKRKKPDTNENA